MKMNSLFGDCMAYMASSEQFAEDTVLKVSLLKNNIEAVLYKHGTCPKHIWNINITVKFYAPDLTKVLSANLYFLHFAGRLAAFDKATS